MIYTQPYTPGATFVLFLFPILPFTHRLLHISPNEAQTDTQSQSSVVISSVFMPLNFTHLWRWPQRALSLNYLAYSHT